MPVIVAADVHGANGPLRSLLHPLGPFTLLSPWSGDGHPHANEQEATNAFHAAGGLTEYERRLADAVHDRPVLLIGFSVGATSLWRYIASARCNPRSRALLYYGSRIRDLLTLSPRCAASLVFAEHEHSFQPHTITPVLSKAGARCEIIAGTRHGFMNPLSESYRPDIAQVQVAHWKALLSNETARPGSPAMSPAGASC